MYDTGATAFMLVCAMLVLLMTPGVAFFTADLRVVRCQYHVYVVRDNRYCGNRLDSCRMEHRLWRRRIKSILWRIRSVRLPVFRKRYARRSAST